MKSVLTHIALIVIAFTMVGCSSSKGGKGGAYGPHAEFHWAKHDEVGKRCGYSTEQINKYRLEIEYRAGDYPSNGTWGSNSCDCLAWNERKSSFYHNHVYFGLPSNPSVVTALPWIASHESLHEYIQSNPEHGGNALPASHRRGGAFEHPQEIYVMGAWRNCKALVQGRWPAVVNENRPTGFMLGVIPHTVTPPFSCNDGPTTMNWHD